MNYTNEIPDLSFLDDVERAKIIEVLNRDQLLRRKQTEKYLKLKQEIELIESKSIDIPSDHINTATVCVRCRQSFGYFFNKGDFCKQCGFKVCQRCRIDQVGSGFLFSNQIENKIMWLCILCHKYNQYLVQTGDWIYNPPLKDAGLEFFNLKVKNSDSIVNNKSQSVSASNNFVKSPLSGSQLITLSLCPTKKEEIIEELETVNFNKPTLSKRYSTIKKARSQNLLNEKKHSSYKNSLDNGQYQLSAKSNDQLASETNQTPPFPNDLPESHNKLILDNTQSISMAPLDNGDDLQSITSSEFDNNSILTTDATRLIKQQNLVESTDQATLHDLVKYEKKTESSSNHSSLLDLANRKVTGPRKLNQRDKSHTSLSAFRGTNDQDYEMNQMDMAM